MFSICCVATASSQLSRSVLIELLEYAAHMEFGYAKNAGEDLRIRYLDHLADFHPQLWNFDHSYPPKLAHIFAFNFSSWTYGSWQSSNHTQEGSGDYYLTADYETGTRCGDCN